MSRVKETGVGIIFFAALIGLGVLTITLGEFTLFGLLGERHELTAYFDQGRGLKTGDNVRVMGVIRGKVKEIDFLPEPYHLPGHDEDLWVRAVLNLEMPLSSVLKKDFVIRIRNSNMLGGKVVDIDIGTSREPLPAGAGADGFFGIASADPLEQIGDMIADNRPKIDRIIENVDGFAGDFRSFSEDIRTGGGVLHDLIYDKSMGQTVRGTLTTVRNAADGFAVIVRDARTGGGLLGQTIYNEEWSGSVTEILNSAEGFVGKATGIVDDVRAGRGVIGQAVYNDTWPARISSLLANADDTMAHVKSGQGPLGLVLFDEVTGRNIAEGIANFRRVSDIAADVAQSLADGKGVIGLLLTDEAVAAQVRALLDQALLSLEDAREAAPISSLGSFLFGAF
jgi:hypothetical protein